MKKLKKIFAALLAMTMVLGMGVTSFASQTTPPADSHDYKTGSGKNNDTATITINGITENNANVYAFPVIQAEYNGHEGLFSGYKPVYTTGDTAISLSEVENPTSALEDKLAKLISSFTFSENGIYQSGATVAPRTISYDTTAGTYKDTTVPIGAYLVVITGADSKVYNPMIVSVSYVVNDNGNIENTTFDIAGASIWAKSSNQPTIKKTSASLTGNTANTGDAARTANIGDTVQYTVEVNPIPYFEGAHPKMRIEDTLSTGLTFSSTVETVEVYAGTDKLTKDTDYTVAINGQKLTLNFVVENKGYTLNPHQTKVLKVVYKAVVNNNSALNSDANENDAKLYYSKNSNVQSDDDPTPPSSKTYTYTFDLSATISGSSTTSFIKKTGEIDKETNKPALLPGAVFTLYKGNTATAGNEYTNTAATPSITNGIVKSDANGNLIIRGLAAGTYCLKEKSAPAGYSVNETLYVIQIIPEYYTATDEATNSNNKEGSLKKWSIKINDTEVAYATIEGGTKNAVVKAENKESFDIQNTKLSSLPSTGGIGTTIFTIGGCAIMILAAGLYFASRRRSVK